MGRATLLSDVGMLHVCDNRCVCRYDEHDAGRHNRCVAISIIMSDAVLNERCDCIAFSVTIIGLYQQDQLSQKRLRVYGGVHGSRYQCDPASETREILAGMGLSMMGMEINVIPMHVTNNITFRAFQKISFVDPIETNFGT